MYQGRVHFTTIEEILEGEPMTAGMFLVNQHPVIVLFDYGSSHSFMSQAFAQKHNQRIDKLGYSYCIGSVGDDVSTRLVVCDVAIDFGSRRCGLDLIVLPGLPLDVILGMSWMKR
jgi:predicted aspartyl protease